MLWVLYVLAIDVHTPVISCQQRFVIGAASRTFKPILRRFRNVRVIVDMLGLVLNHSKYVDDARRCSALTLVARR